MNQAKDPQAPRTEDQAVPVKRRRKTTQERAQPEPVEEIGGPKGLEPTRYGDWERKGRCIDF